MSELEKILDSLLTEYNFDRFSCKYLVNDSKGQPKSVQTQIWALKSLDFEKKKNVSDLAGQQPTNGSKDRTKSRFKPLENKDGLPV